MGSAGVARASRLFLLHFFFLGVVVDHSLVFPLFLRVVVDHSGFSSGLWWITRVLFPPTSVIHVGISPFNVGAPVFGKPTAQVPLQLVEGSCVKPDVPLQTREGTKAGKISGSPGNAKAR